MVKVTMTFRTASVSNAMYNMIQVSDIGPSWPSCLCFFVLFSHFFSFIILVVVFVLFFFFSFFFFFFFFFFCLFV